MNAIIHIGPPKTASTALQNAIIPQLGRPFLIKPDWLRPLCHKTDYPTPDISNLPPDIIISDEIIGAFATFSPETVADRLARVFRTATVVFVKRDNVELFYSLYRQILTNVAHVQGKTAAQGKPLTFAPVTIDSYFDKNLRSYRGGRHGFFAVIRDDAVRFVFERYFTFRVVEFDLLKTRPSEFVSAFSLACGCKHVAEMPVENKTEESNFVELVNSLPPQVPKSQLIDCYLSKLSPDRENYIRNFAMLGSEQSFA